MLNEILKTLDQFYDVEAIKFDHENGNFDLDNWQDEIEKYYMPRIVAESWINGQAKQARDQYAVADLHPADLQDYLKDSEIIRLVTGQTNKERKAAIRRHKRDQL